MLVTPQNPTQLHPMPRKQKKSAYDTSKWGAFPQIRNKIVDAMQVSA